MALFFPACLTRHSLFFRPLALLVALLPLAAHAQRADGGHPAEDPFGKRHMAARAVPGGHYRSHFLADNRLEIQATDGSTIRLANWSDGVVKVDYFAPGQPLRADSSVSVVRPTPAEMADALEAAADRVREEGERIADAMEETADAADADQRPGAEPFLYFNLPENLLAIVQKSPLRIRLVQPDGTVLCEAGSAFRVAAASSSATTNGAGVRFRLAPGEQLYGTGSRALPVDRRGYRLELYNQAHYGSQNSEPNLNITLPTVLSSRGYMLFFDHHAPGHLDLGKTDKNVLEYSGEGLNSLSYFVIMGKNQAEILNRYTALTGRQPLPPRWALGLIQSRFGYKSSEEMEAVAARMRRENFPLDALVLDLYWFGGIAQQGNLAWDKTHFLNPTGLMASLKKQGVQTILISEPYIMRTSRNDSTVRALGLVGTTAAGRPFTVASFWAGPASIVDVFKPSARAWLWSYYSKLHDQGAAGWWSDLGEPENHPAAMQHVFGSARAVHNAYGQAWAGIFQENYAREFPEERLFNLARSGWAGMQRNSVFPWSGDINRSWSGLQAQVPVMLGMGQGGVGYMHSDAGGFCVGSIDSELYTRWLQMTSLCPILRPHGEGVPPEPYFYPEPYKSAVRNALHLRYELLPYLYSLAYQNSLTGEPLVRSMDYELNYGLEIPNPELAAASNVATATQPASFAQFRTHNSKFIIPSDQYLLGPNLLVAPILNPSQRRRNVTLPVGPWIDFYTNRTYAGGQTVGMAAPLARTPLLVKAGAFVPMTAYRPSTSRYRPDTLLLRYYPDPSVAESEFTMYDDDGHSAQAIARKQYETFTARAFRSTAQTDVLLNSAGEYPGQPVFRLLRLLVQRVAAPPTSILFDGQEAPTEGWSYNSQTHELEVHFLMNTGVAVSLHGLKILPNEVLGSEPDLLTLEAPDQRIFGPGGTTLHYTRHAAYEDAPEALLIRDTQGTVVRQLTLERTAGPHTLRWDGRDAQGRTVAIGVYVAEAAGQHQRLIITP